MITILKVLGIMFWGVCFVLAFVMFWVFLSAFYFLVRMFND